MKGKKVEYDIDEFMKQKAHFEKYAAQEVAIKLEEIKTRLREIEKLVQISKMDIRLGGSYGELTDLIASIDSNHPDWNSSSYDC